MKTESKKTVNLTLLPDEAEALEWIADYGIQEKEYVLTNKDDWGYTREEIKEQKQTLRAANNALGILQAAIAKASEMKK